MAEILHQAPDADRRQHVRREEAGLGRPVLLAVAFAFACLGLAMSGYLVVAIVPALFSVVAVMAVFRVMG
jgi:hypothetical protein